MPYSEDLRWRVVWANEYHNLPPGVISSRFFISVSTVYRILREHRLYGRVIGRNSPGRPLSFSEADFHVLLEILIENPSIYLREIQALLNQKLQRIFSLSTICRALARSKVTKKKVDFLGLNSQLQSFKPLHIDWKNCSTKKWRTKGRFHPGQVFVPSKSFGLRGWIRDCKFSIYSWKSKDAFFSIHFKGQEVRSKEDRLGTAGPSIANSLSTPQPRRAINTYSRDFLGWNAWLQCKTRFNGPGWFSPLLAVQFVALNEPIPDGKINSCAWFLFLSFQSSFILLSFVDLDILSK